MTALFVVLGVLVLGFLFMGFVLSLAHSMDELQGSESTAQKRRLNRAARATTEDELYTPLPKSDAEQAAQLLHECGYPKEGTP